MSNIYSSLVKSDTATEWASLKAGMPWSSQEAGAEKLVGLGIEQVDIALNEAAISELLDTSPAGTVWGEFVVEPFVQIGDDYSAFVMNCLTTAVLTQVPSFSSLSGISKSEKPWVEGLPTFATSWMVIACPRCHLTATDGDPDEEIDFYDEDWIDEDCIACEGTGEWEFELF